MEQNPKEDLVSYTDAGAPSLTVIFKKGRRMTWPHYLLGMGEYRPENFDEEGIAGREMESLRINAGEELVIVTGFDLLPIFTGLTQGQGGALREYGTRYSGIRTKGKPYIAEIQVKKLRDQEEE
jgi:hypothetical protein